MSRVRTLFLTILPSAIAGGFLFASAFGHAETGREGTLGFWPAASDSATGSVLVAQADPRPTPRPRGVPPMPPMPPSPPTAGAPPMPPPYSSHGRGHGHGRGMSVSIHDGKVEIDGIAELVQDSLEKALDTLDNLPDVSPDDRDRLKGRIKGLRDRIKQRLGKLKGMDIERLGPELERMGDDIERDMSGLDQDLAQLGEKVGKSFAQKFGKDFAKSFGPSVAQGNSHDSDDSDSDDDDDDDDSNTAVAIAPTPQPEAVDPSDVGPPIAALRGISLDPGQRAKLVQLRADSDRQISLAKRELEVMSSRLHDSLRDGAVSPADIDAQIDSISAKEATIRKARIGAWLKARSLLKADQRKQIEQAVHKSH